MNYRLIVCVHGDNRGKPVALESEKDIPFEVFESDYYEEKEYIKDYNKSLKEVAK